MIRFINYHCRYVAIHTNIKLLKLHFIGFPLLRRDKKRNHCWLNHKNMKEIAKNRLFIADYHYLRWPYLSLEWIKTGWFSKQINKRWSIWNEKINRHHKLNGKQKFLTKCIRSILGWIKKQSQNIPRIQMQLSNALRSDGRLKILILWLFVIICALITIW